LPKSVATYTPPKLPDDPELRTAGTAWIDRLAAAMESGTPQTFDLTALTAPERRFLDEFLRPGEVTALALGEPLLQAEETVFAGLWRIRSTEPGTDYLEIADIPAILRTRAAAAPLPMPPPETIPPGLTNAPHILAELLARSAAFTANATPYMLNLGLVPLTDAELTWLVTTLGEGPVIIISAGYGACRIRSTNLAHTWWVQFSNASDALILNSLEVTEIPAVACAAPDDIADSAKRLRALRALYA
jgi:hydrogenase-1 operon protein HyaF